MTKRGKKGTTGGEFHGRNDLTLSMSTNGAGNDPSPSLPAVGIHKQCFRILSTTSAWRSRSISATILMLPPQSGHFTASTSYTSLINAAQTSRACSSDSRLKLRASSRLIGRTRAQDREVSSESHPPAQEDGRSSSDPMSDIPEAMPLTHEAARAIHEAGRPSQEGVAGSFEGMAG